MSSVSDTDDNEDILLSEDTESSNDLYAAALTLALLDYKIDDEDLSGYSISINCKQLAGMCELLLLYAEMYEEVDVDSLFDYAEEAVCNDLSPSTPTIH